MWQYPRVVESHEGTRILGRKLHRPPEHKCMLRVQREAGSAVPWCVNALRFVHNEVQNRIRCKTLQMFFKAHILWKELRLSGFCKDHPLILQQDAAGMFKPDS